MVFAKARARAFAFCPSLVITDRPCAAAEFAIEHNIPHERVSGPPSATMSDEILSELQRHEIEFAYVFYSRMFEGALIEQYCGRLINFHPSMLPAHPGLRGFEDSVSSKSLLIGTTIHVVDAGMDSGTQLLQTVASSRGTKDVASLRHILFAQQCASLYQIHTWITSGSLTLTPLKFADSIQFILREGFCPAISAGALLLYEELLSE